LDKALAAGLHLESLKRWSDAVAHYEEALRDFPEDSTLRQREDLAKLHFSLQRRYADRSYVQSLQTLSASQSAGLYRELLRKVQTHYVTAPQWARLAQRGVDALDVALGDEQFSAANGLNLSPQQLAQIRRELFQIADQRAFASPEDVAAAAADAAKLVENRCGLRQSAAFLEFVTSTAGGLDEYSSYLTSDQLRDVYSQIEGNFVGLGVELKADRGELLIVHVIPGSPAQRAGILDGDRIVAVDGRPTAEMSTDAAASMLTGPEGSTVRVVAVSPGRPQRELTVRREHVEVPSLEEVGMIDAAFSEAKGLNLSSEQIAEGIAYVRIPAFQKTTSRDLEAALWKLHSQGMQTLVIDLRGNPGGLLTAAVEVADKFLLEGDIVSTHGRSAQEDFEYRANYGGTWRVPLVVLIDGDSASASEIFAAAIKDNRRGTIVGEKSYGKGTVQGIFPLGYGGTGVRLTTALFYGPNGEKISHQGVTPDEEVHMVAKAGAGATTSLKIVGSDPILEAGAKAAIAASKQRLASR
jgi:carboxyl-terminal processing protease